MIGFRINPADHVIFGPAIISVQWDMDRDRNVRQGTLRKELLDYLRSKILAVSLDHLVH